MKLIQPTSKDSTQRRLLLAFVLLTALVLLTGGLRDLEIQGAATIRVAQEGDATGDSSNYLLANQIFVMVAFLVLVTVLALVVLLNRRKREVVILGGIALLILFLYLLPESDAREERTALPAATLPVLVEELPPTEPPPGPEITETFVPPQVSSIVLYLVSFVAVATLMVTAWLALRWRAPQDFSSGANPALGEIGEAARLALEDLAAGLDERDAVIACYARMSDVVMRSRNLERGASRTATEFAARLESAGLPGASVRRLTRLFESVRYGARASEHVDAEEARACLAEIARHCGETP